MMRPYSSEELNRAAKPVCLKLDGHAKHCQLIIEDIDPDFRGCFCLRSYPEKTFTQLCKVDALNVPPGAAR